MKYDPNNIFAKIIRGEVPCAKVYEDEYSFAFHDIAPAAPVHVLVLPKGEYTSFHDFAENNSDINVANFFKSVRRVADMLGLEQGGYRILFNHGKNASQTVFHFHVHILGGKPLGALVVGDNFHR